MVPRRRRVFSAALTLLSCSCPTLAFLPSTPHTAAAAAATARRAGNTATAADQVARSESRQCQSRTRALVRQCQTRTRALARGDLEEGNRHNNANRTGRKSTTTTRGVRMMMAANESSSSSNGSAAELMADAPVVTTSSSGASTPVAAPRKDDDDDDDDDDEVPLTLDKALEEGVNRAMRGDPGVLRQVLAPGVEWRGPLGNNAGLARVEEELRGLGSLLNAPRMSVFASKDGAKRLEWVASGTWPLPWLPRFIVKGASTLQTGPDGKVVKITDTWEGNPVTLGLKHLVPGFWDIWHQLGSPPAEKPPYRVVKRALGYVIREYAPRMATQPSLIDYSNSREIRKALILPGFCHDGEIKTSGRKPDEYYVTGPLEVAIQPFIATGSFPNGTWFNGTAREASQSRRANRITWTVPIPTAMGLDPTKLPEPPSERERGEDQRSRHVRQGARRIAVTNFNGIPQDPEAAEVRAKLLKRLAADGVEPSRGADGRVRSGILMHNSVACFTKAGKLAMSILYHRPKYIGIGNEVFVELDPEEAVTEEVVEGKVGGGTW
ncbi:unnamed protein product [Ectocarpus sp. 13 AM-2016]